MENVKETTAAREASQRFDPVHDTQRVYRALLDAMARPGTILDIGPATSKWDRSPGFNRTAAAISLTLLDGEVGHAVRMDESRPLADFIRRMTFSPAVAVHEADYVFADGASDAEAVARLAESLKRGTHEAPDLGATLLLSVKELGSEAACERKWMLSGPGIADEAVICISGLAAEWLTERNKANAEYPLGIDIVLFTEEGLLAALPRTTNIKEMDQPWHM